MCVCVCVWSPGVWSTNLEADLALPALPLPPVEADHVGLVALLPVQRHGLVALAEGLDLVLLHVGDDLRWGGGGNARLRLSGLETNSLLEKH